MVDIAFSPNNCFLFILLNQAITVYNIVSGIPKQTVRFGLHFAGIETSPDGLFVTTWQMGSPEIFIWNNLSDRLGVTSPEVRVVFESPLLYAQADSRAQVFKSCDQARPQDSG